MGLLALAKKLFFWLLDFTAQQVLAASLGSAVVTATVSAVVRQFVIPSWEWTWVLWTSTAFVSYLVLLKTVRWWLPNPSVKGKADAMPLDYDPSEPKHFSPKTAQQLFDIAHSGRSTRAIETELKPHIGLWLSVEGAITDTQDDAGDDGRGGKWATLTIDHADYTKGLVLPRPVVMYFMGKHADVARALEVGAGIKACGRITVTPTGLGTLALIPSELVEYPIGHP